MARKLQQLKLEIQRIRTNLLNLMKAITYFASLGILLLIWKQEKKDIFAMIRQLSLPTWLMSLSAADTRWTDLLRMSANLNDGIEYSVKEVDKMTWQEKTKLVQKDQVTCSRYFDHRVQEFLNTILKSDCEPIGKVKDYFYRVEFQQRGSPHIHMLVWIENAPTLDKNSEEEIVEFVDQYLTCSADNKETANTQTFKNLQKEGKTRMYIWISIASTPKNTVAISSCRGC